MKHTLKITIILLSMFIVTQMIGLVVLHADPFYITQEVNGTIQRVTNPYLSWIQPPEATTPSESYSLLTSLLISFTLAILLLFILSKFKTEIIIKAWFFVVVSVALFIATYSLQKLIPINTSQLPFVIIALILAIPLAFIKIYKKNFFIHNMTELLVYPGIATIFVPILNVTTIIILLILISIYDAWAVWHSGFMQKMAKYQLNKLDIFSGFLIPYGTEKLKMKLQKIKESKKKKEEKIKLNVAILGGGDVVFPIIAAGVMLKTFGLLSALLVILGATLGISYLFFFAEKKKFYPAMPFITAGIFLGMIINLVLM